MQSSHLRIVECDACVWCDNTVVTQWFYMWIKVWLLPPALFYCGVSEAACRTCELDEASFEIPHCFFFLQTTEGPDLFSFVCFKMKSYGISLVVSRMFNWVQSILVLKVLPQSVYQGTSHFVKKPIKTNQPSNILRREFEPLPSGWRFGVPSFRLNRSRNSRRRWPGTHFSPHESIKLISMMIEDSLD